MNTSFLPPRGHAKLFPGLPSPESNSAPLHILVVEDATADFELIEGELQRTGLNFSSTRLDAPEGLSRELDRQPPHLVLCDHDTDRAEGFHVLAVVRARSPALPFIVVTDLMPAAEMMEAFARGADEVVFKNRLGELRPAVERALRLGEARQRAAQAEAERDRLRGELEAWRFGRPSTPVMLPICAGCKKIRSPQDEWIQMERYLHDHFNLHFSHGLCAPCVETFSEGIDECPGPPLTPSRDFAAE